MKNSDFNKGVILTALGSFWWGVFGVIYFKYISFAGHIEVVLHRSLWTSGVLILTTFYFSKWKLFFLILSDKKKMIILFLLINFLKNDLVNYFAPFTIYLVFIIGILNTKNSSLFKITPTKSYQDTGTKAK